MAPASDPSLWKRAWRRIVAASRSLSGRLLISTILLVAALRALPFEWSVVLSTLSTVDWRYLGLALLVQVAGVYFSARRTQVVLAVGGRRYSMLALWQLAMVGEAINRVVPGNLGSLAYLASKLADEERGRILSLLVAEKFIYLFFVLLAGAASVLTLGAPWVAVPLAAATAGLALVAGGVGWASSLHPRLAVAREWIVPLLAAIAQRPRTVLSYVLAVALGLSSAALAFVSVLRAIGVSIGVSVAYGCTTLVTIATALPLTLNGIGLREWVTGSFLESHFHDGGFASYVLLSYLVVFSVSGVGALLAAVQPVRAATCPE
jgi:uncharacterized membrane protein YbhN (UPF0104 family)